MRDEERSLATKQSLRSEIQPEETIWRTDAHALAAEHSARKPKLAQILVALSCIPVTAIAIFDSVIRGSAMAPGIVAFWFCMTFTYGVIGYRERWARDRIAVTPTDLEALDDRDDPAEVLVEVSVLQSGAVTGVDYGLLVIEEGALVFSGRRSTFCLGAQDLLQRSSGILPVRPADPMHGALPLHLYHPKRDITLYIRPMVIRKRNRTAEETLVKIMLTFSTSAATPVKRQYPPLAWDPLLPVDLRYRPRLETFGWSLQIAALIWFGSGHVYGYLFMLFPFVVDFMKWWRGKSRRIREAYLAIAGLQ